ncbi:MAG: hypothetical protein H6704_06670 [Myxococcales bacterium]|nr:hypothetical protein [Myxococcales bacterium]
MSTPKEAHDRIQRAGKGLLIYAFSLMKTGEAHEMNNEAWLRPIEKMLDALGELIQLERQAITIVVHEGIAKVNSHALWLDKGAVEQANELEQWLARREAGGIIFKQKPKDPEIRQFFSQFARFRAPEGTKDQMKALAEAIEAAGVTNMKLAPQPLALDGVGTGVRGVATLWHYAKSAAAMSEVLRLVPVEVRSARRIAQELVDTCTVEQDLLCAMPLLASGDEPYRRAVDVAVLVAATARGLGLSRTECADLTTLALLHVEGHAYANPDPTEFTVPEAVGVLAVRQLAEATRVTPPLALRVAASLEWAIGPTSSGPPYLAGPPQPIAPSQLIALASAYLNQVRGDGKRPAQSPLKVGLQLLSAPPSHLDPSLVRCFVATMGLLPVSTIVELHNGDLGVVADVDHLRGRKVYGASPAPVSARRHIVVERMRTRAGQVVPERKARVQLGEDDGQGGEWTVHRTLARDGLEDLVLRALIRRPSTVVAQMGLR